MMPYFTDIVSPPGSEYGISAGIEAKEALDEARTTIAMKLQVDPNEIIFTSGQTESNNLAIKGIAFANLNSKNRYIVASSVSHFSVLDSLESLKKYFDFEYDLIKVDSEGFIDRNHLNELLAKNPLIVSIPHGNQEIGTVEDLEDIITLCHKSNSLIHVEASYSLCKVPLDGSKPDLVTITSHLIHGPKGVGALKIGKKVKMVRLMDGGLQENQKRGGTENIPGIVGFATAVSEYTPEVNKRTQELRDYLWEKLSNNLSNFQLTGAIDRTKRLPNHLSLVFNYVEGESILLHLDMLGFMIATGSACSSKRLEASHVLTAIGLPTEISHGSVRIGLSKYNTKEEIDAFIPELAKVIKRLREMSPVDEEFMKEYFEMKASGKIHDEHDHHHEIEEHD